jgi:hypothetical protein
MSRSELVGDSCCGGGSGSGSGDGGSGDGDGDDDVGSGDVAEATVAAVTMAGRRRQF